MQAVTIALTGAEPHLADQGAFEAALDHLVSLDARLVPVLQVAGRPALRRRAPGFAGLAALVVAQQISTAAARSIQARLDGLFGGPLEAEALLARDPADLRGAGLSAPKIRTLTGIARMLGDGEVDLDAVAHMEAEAAIAALVRLPGIGRWTADIYLLFCLGRGDAFPSGDLALQVAAGEALGLPGRASPAGLEAIARDWQPVRGVAAHLLWAYYGARRARIGVPA